MLNFLPTREATLRWHVKNEHVKTENSDDSDDGQEQAAMVVEEEMDVDFKVTEISVFSLVAKSVSFHWWLNLCLFIGG